MNLSLISKGRSSYVISIRKNAEEPERFAAEELSRYLHQISGARLPIEIKSPRSHVIQIEATLKAKQTDAFTIQTRANKLLLGGASSRAALHAVYTFLEDQLGCGWIKPGDDQIPEMDEVRIGKLDVRREPSFASRVLVHFPYIRAKALMQIDWMAKQKLNALLLATNNDLGPWERGEVRDRLIPEIRKRGLELRGTGHAFFAWVPPAKYFKKHPEYFALLGGKREADPQKSSLCLSNPAVAREIARNMARFAKKNPEVQVITLWGNDTTGWCECDGCRAMDIPKETCASFSNSHKHGRNFARRTAAISITKSQLAFVNRVAELVEETNPELQIETLAYGQNYNPSPHAAPRKNVLAGFAMFDKLLSSQHALLPTHHRANQPIPDYIRRWRKQTKRFYLYEYFALFHAFTPLLDVMSKDFKWYRSVGVHGISSETAMWNELHMYAFAKLAWNSSLTADEILRHYCSRAYGSVADMMFQHWNLLRESRLQWNYDVTVRAIQKLPVERWFEQQRANPRWKRCETACLALLEQAISRLQKSPLSPSRLAAQTDARIVERIRDVRSRWSETPWPWYRVPD
ncbi:MAG: DUF4838 domain-containing protein [Verrucomicrobia bacterium]|nr:DUF4838 domain-containing protein [Verrucomicrobiota bacterium]